MSTKEPLVSIIINCHNSEQFLKEAIDSIYAQTYLNWEIIFWDNASTDHSATIAKSYDNKLKYYLAVRKTPLGEARNLALKKATGKYIAFLDCDDLYLPDKLAKQVRLMDMGDYAMCYGSAIIIDKYDKEVKKIPVKNRSGYLFPALLKHYEINMQSVMLRHTVLVEEKLNFATHLQYGPDYNLFMQIAAYHPIAVVVDFIGKYRVLSDSLSKQTIDIVSSEIQFTLDLIAKDSPDLKQNFSQEFDQAYKKLHYYDAVAQIYKNNKTEARKKLRPIIGSRVEYLLLYLLLFLPLSSQRIFKILSR